MRSVLHEDAACLTDWCVRSAGGQVELVEVVCEVQHVPLVVQVVP
jgi:hypothetical protein